MGDEKKPIVLMVEERAPVYEVKELPFTNGEYRLIYRNIPENPLGSRFSKEEDNRAGYVTSYLEARERLIRRMRLIVLSLMTVGATIALILVTLRPI